MAGAALLGLHGEAHTRVANGVLDRLGLVPDDDQNVVGRHHLGRGGDHVL